MIPYFCCFKWRQMSICALSIDHKCPFKLSIHALLTYHKHSSKSNKCHLCVISLLWIQFVRYQFIMNIHLCIINLLQIWFKWYYLLQVYISALLACNKCPSMLILTHYKYPFLQLIAMANVGMNIIDKKFFDWQRALHCFYSGGWTSWSKE